MGPGAWGCWVLLLACLAGPCGAGAQPEAETPQAPAYGAVLVKDLAGREPTREFDCLSRVYLYVTWYRVYGPHRVTALWYNPQGKQEDAHDLDFEGGEEVSCWLALEFINVQNERNPMMVNTAAARFHGNWKVKLLLDGQEVETLPFSVSCG